MPTQKWGENSTDDYNGVTEDSYIRADTSYCTVNYDGSGIIIKQVGSGFPSFSRQSLIRFNVSAISGATIQDARLYLYVTSITSGTHVIGVYAQSRPWVEGEVTWTEYSSGNSWTDGSCTDAIATHDRGSLFTSKDVDGESQNAYMYFSGPNFTQAVQDAVDGAGELNLILMNVSDADGGVNYSAGDSEWTDGQRPYLWIDYAADQFVTIHTRRLHFTPTT